MRKLNIDFDENAFKDDILALLLKDQSSKKNILWCTNDYLYLGDSYHSNQQILIDLITGKNNGVIKPRIAKLKNDRTRRMKGMAEVYTPSWMCNKQNNLIDNKWFGYVGAFNIEKNNFWISTTRVRFTNKNWKQYVFEKRIEITCGEAPYIVSRYDATTGEYIHPKDRIGLLDRKLRVISENVDDVTDWKKWAICALKSVFGYEYQGDSLLLARENVLLTFIEFYKDKFGCLPEKDCLVEAATIISWNFWQMDGFTGTIPNTCHDYDEEIVTIFETKIVKHKCAGCETNNIFTHNGTRCLIMDWDLNKEIEYISTLRN